MRAVAVAQQGRGRGEEGGATELAERPRPSIGSSITGEGPELTSFFHSTTTSNESTRGRTVSRPQMPECIVGGGC